jgi:hypothetical protein
MNNHFYTPPWPVRTVIDRVLKILDKPEHFCAKSIAQDRNGAPCYPTDLDRNKKPVAVKFSLVGALTIATDDDASLRYNILWSFRQFLSICDDDEIGHIDPVAWCAEKDRTLEQIRIQLDEYAEWTDCFNNPADMQKL